MCFQTLQEQSQVFQKAPAVMEVHSGFYEIWLFELTNSEGTESSVQVCGRLREHLWPQCRSAGDFESSAGDLVPYSHSSGSWCSTTARRFVYQIRLCYSHKIHYILIRHVSSKSLYIHTYEDTGITEMDPGTGSISFGDLRVNRHRRIIRNSHTIFPILGAHSFFPLFRGSSWPGSILSSHPHPALLQPELLFLKNSFRIPCEARQNVGDGHFAFSLHRFTTSWSIELGVALRGRDRATLEMHLEAGIERVWRYTWKLWSSEFEDAPSRLESIEFGDTIGSRNRASLEIHLQAGIERVWICTWRPWSSEIEGVLGGGRSGGGSSGGRCDWSWDSIHWLTHNGGNVEYNMVCRVMRDWLGAGDSRCLDDAVHGVCSTQCMLYSVYALLGVCCTRCMLYLVLTLDHGMER